MNDRPYPEQQRTSNEPSTALERIEMAHASGASELDLARQGLTELPEALFQLVNLQHLDLAGRMRQNWEYDGA